MNRNDLIELVHGYFASERETALIGGLLGASLILAAFFLWGRGVGSFQRGMAYPLIVFGLFQIFACIGYAYVLEKRAASIMAVYGAQPVEDARAAEEARMRKVMSDGYKGAFRIFGVLIAVGAVMLLLSHGLPSRRGVAGSLMLVGVLGIALETYSRHKNGLYLQTILDPAGSQLNSAKD